MRSKAITIGNATVQPGEMRLIEIPLAPLVTHDQLSMELAVKVGKKAGPKMFVCAAIHGDEINGVDIIRRLLIHPALKKMAGTLLAIPVVNVHGFLHQSRYLPDGRDLNRAFPGSSKGSLTSRVAKKFVDEILSQCDFGIDLHTGARHRTNLPQLRFNFSNAQAKLLAEAFGVPVTLNSKLRDCSLRAAATDMDIPVLTYEGGEALRFDELATRAGLHGILNVMRYTGMLPSSRRKNPLPAPLFAEQSIWVRASTSGILRCQFALGQRVKKGDTIAFISDPMGLTESSLQSPEDGIMIGKTQLPIVNEGDALFHIACYPYRAAKAADALQAMQEHLEDADTLASKHGEHYQKVKQKITET